MQKSVRMFFFIRFQHIYYVVFRYSAEIIAKTVAGSPSVHIIEQNFCNFRRLRLTFGHKDFRLHLNRIAIVSIGHDQTF